MHWRSGEHSLWDLLALGVFVAAVLYCCSFVLLHPEIVRNRFTDAWWHIAAAEEYARTGVFAKDPFIPDAPPFAQFGLMEFVNARVGRALGIAHERMFVYLIAVQVAVFLAAAFLTGCLPRQRASDGLVVAGLTFVRHGHHGVIGNGLPFNTALAVFYLLVVGFALRRHMENRKAAIARAAGFGAALGLLFDLHAFTGLMALAVVGLMRVPRNIPPSLSRALSRALATKLPTKFLGSGFKVQGWVARALVAVAAFFAVSWRWWLHHLALRPALALHNAHSMTVYSVPAEDIVMVGIAVVMVGVVWVAGIGGRNLELSRNSGTQERGEGIWKAGKEEDGLPEFLSSKLDRSPWFAKCLYVPGNAHRLACWLAAFGLLLLLLCVPSIHWIVGRATSRFMAARVCSFFPLGVAVLVGVMACFGSGTRRWGRVAIGVCLAILAVTFFLPRAWHVARLQYYLLRTEDYDAHPFEHLRQSPGRPFDGNLVLSDPWTSYFARGMIGTYAVSVPSGHASPAVDYDARDEFAKRALAEGPSALGGRPVAAVFVNQRNDVTAAFAGCAADEIVRVWTAGGWQVTADTPEVTVLVPGSR